MRSKNGLTLIETIVLVGVIIVLFLILSPMLEKRRIEKPYTIACMANLKQLLFAYVLYCEDNNNSFSSGVTGKTDRDDWLVSLDPYYKVEKRLLICREAKSPRSDGKEYGGPNNSYLVSVEKEGSQKISIEGSYGINNWVYNPAPDSNIVSKYPADNFWRTNNNPNASQVPLFADAMWAGGFPEPDGTAGQPPIENGEWDSIDAAMKHFCIDRHSGAINMVFMDGHAEEVGLKDLWKLKWHKNFDTSGQWTKPDASWPEWMKKLKKHK